MFTSRVLFQRNINIDTQIGTQLALLSVGTNILLQINPAFVSMQFVLMAAHSIIIHVDHNRTLQNPSLITFLISPYHVYISLTYILVSISYDGRECIAVDYVLAELHLRHFLQTKTRQAVHV